MVKNIEYRLKVPYSILFHGYAGATVFYLCCCWGIGIEMHCLLPLNLKQLNTINCFTNFKHHKIALAAFCSVLRKF